jgi:hypothetical protein
MSLDLNLVRRKYWSLASRGLVYWGLMEGGMVWCISITAIVSKGRRERPGAAYLSPAVANVPTQR